MDEPDADELMRAHFDHAAVGYDDWWLGTGRFAERDRPGWSAEVDQLIGVLQSLPPARVLDVACGTGFLTQHFRGQVVGLDQSAQMVEIAAARMPHARVVQGDIAPLPFDDGEFDRVFTSHFFHHLAPDRRASFLAEARRVGHEIVVVEDVRSPDAPKEEWRDLGPRRWFTPSHAPPRIHGGRALGGARRRPGAPRGALVRGRRCELIAETAPSLRQRALERSLSAGRRLSFSRRASARARTARPRHSRSSPRRTRPPP